MEAASTLAPANTATHAGARRSQPGPAGESVAEAECRSGPVGAAEIVRECPWESTMTVGELLRSQRRWGRARAQKFLFSISLNENRELRRLTDAPARRTCHSLVQAVAGATESSQRAGSLPRARRTGRARRPPRPPAPARPPQALSASLMATPARAKGRASPHPASAATSTATTTRAPGGQVGEGVVEQRQHRHAGGSRRAAGCGSDSRRSAREPTARGRPASRARAR